MRNFDFILRDGRAVHIRAMRLDDEDELLQTFEQMSPEARYMRFMHVVREPNLEKARKVLASFPENGIGIVATVPTADGSDIVGSAVAVFDTTRTRCEFGITVASLFGGVGLASALMTSLIDGATHSGVKEMEGFVLKQNDAMLRLAKKLGFRLEADPDDPSVRLCRMTLSQLPK